MFPPSTVVVHGAVTAAAFAAAIALAGIGLGVTVVATAAIAAAQALPLSAGAAPYIGFSGRMLWFAVWIAALTVAMIKGREQWRSAAAAFRRGAIRPAVFRRRTVLRLLGLLHPCQTLVDAVFHAHRLEWRAVGPLFLHAANARGRQFSVCNRLVSVRRAVVGFHSR